MGKLVPAPPHVVMSGMPTHGRRDSTDFLIVHVTEGGDGQTIGNLVSYFQGTPDGLGCQAIVEAGGRIGLVPDLSLRTYTAIGYNRSAVHIEHVGFSADSRLRWARHRTQYWASAWTAAFLASLHGIPPVWAFAPGRRQVAERGFGLHMWLPQNDHDDPGDGFPRDAWLRLVRGLMAQGDPGWRGVAVRAANR